MRNSRSASRSSRPNAFAKIGLPSMVVASHGVEPRTSTAAGTSRATGSPQAASASATSCAVGRWSGAPNTRAIAVPTNQPTAQAITMSSGTLTPARTRNVAMNATATHIACPHLRPTKMRRIVAPAAAAAR